MKQVQFTSKVRQYFKDLVPTLYNLGYFSYSESSQKYVRELIKDIETNLPTRPHKPATKYFDQYGKDMLYATFRKNKQTTWYAFFTKYNENGNTFYLVRHIANNHTVAQYL
ncbi:MAG: hypothetical protein FWE63_01135 [Bacteroidales bacterium]|nr:hypothetical protein [Bacteroidales bacterium]